MWHSHANKRKAIKEALVFSTYTENRKSFYIYDTVKKQVVYEKNK